MERETRWILLYTKPRAEAWAEINLRKDGFTTLLPRIRQRTGFTALFPRYLIAGCQEDAVTAVLPGAVGILYVVHSGDAPAEVPADVIAELRGRMDARGIVSLDASSSADSLFSLLRRARVRALLKRVRADVPIVA